MAGGADDTASVTLRPFADTFNPLRSELLVALVLLLDDELAATAAATAAATLISSALETLLKFILLKSDHCVTSSSVTV